MSSSLRSHSSSTPSDEPWRRNLSQRENPALLGERDGDWWTGKKPDACPGVDAQGVLRALPAPRLNRCTRDEVLAYFDNGWTLTELLFSSLQGEEAFYRPPYHHLRHPMIFYYCHPAALYINKLRVAGLLGEPVHATFEQLFETGVDEMSWDDMSKNEMLWPRVSEVTQYRRKVYDIVRRCIETHPDLEPGHPPITASSSAWALFLGFEHERIHIETSSVLVRELPLPLLKRPQRWAPLPRGFLDQRAFEPRSGVDFPPNPLLQVGACTAEIGKDSRHPLFGWDNEYGRRTANVRAFEASQFLVSNGEFLEFVRAGGYREPRFWSDEGWSWRTFRNTKCPTFWKPAGPAGLHHFRLRTLFEEIDMPWAAPVCVNWHEAKAFCAWVNESRNPTTPLRLLTEAEHHALRGNPSDRDVWVSPSRFNLALAFGSETPVDAMPPTPEGFFDVFGNVWQWLEDHFHPLPGTKVHPYYDDFSTPCYDGKHQMILGGSFASAGDEATWWARFHFRPHFFQHAGFRLARNTDGNHCVDAVLLQEGGGQAKYESEVQLGQYLALHYGGRHALEPHASELENHADGPARVARLALAWASKLGIDGGRALDVGCAVGRTTFELAAGFDQVLGVDLSRNFVDAALLLRENGEIASRIRIEGEVFQPFTFSRPNHIDPKRVSFRQADAMSLPAELTGFDAVVAANLLCRLPSPKAFLARLGGPRGLVRPGGLLLLITPCSWSEEFTPREVWLGGYVRDGKAVTTRDGLRECLSEEFELLHDETLASLIREHARKFELIYAEATVWKRF